MARTRRPGTSVALNADRGVAVDNSGNLLTKGRVYVVVPQNVVDVFEPKAGGGEKYLAQMTGPEPAVPFAAVPAWPWTS